MCCTSVIYGERSYVRSLLFLVPRSGVYGRASLEAAELDLEAAAEPQRVQGAA